MMLANKLFNFLLEDEIINSEGFTKFTLADISINVHDINIVGYVLQEWLKNYMKKKHIYFRVKKNTQEFPDFLLDTNDSDKVNLLEVKVFTKTPNFDVANFAAYAKSLREHAYRLDAKYLIFEYERIRQNNNENRIIIKNI